MIFRCEKGESLTFLEMDQNFRELLEKITILEENLKKLNDAMLEQPFQGVSMVQEGEEILLKDQSQQECGRIQIPIFRPNLQGMWKGQEYYHMHDWVVFEGKTYGCIGAHVSTTFDQDHEKWRLVIDSQIAH